MVSLAPITHERPTFALAYAWAGVAIMWAFWVSFVIFLAEPRQVLAWWPLPTVDRSDSLANPAFAALIDLALVMLFGLAAFGDGAAVVQEAGHGPHAASRCKE